MKVFNILTCDQIPEIKHMVSDYLILDTLSMAHGAWSLASDTWPLTPDTWNLEPGTWHLGPGTWNLRTWHLKLATWHLKPGTCAPDTCFSNLSFCIYKKHTSAAAYMFRLTFLCILYSLYIVYVYKKHTKIVSVS